MFKIPPHVVWRNVEGELALFHSRNGTYHALNGSGAAIWRAIASGRDLRAVIGALTLSHAARQDEVAADVREFIEAALANDLLVRVESSD